MLIQYWLNKTKTKLPQQRPSTEIAATFSSCYHALSASSHLQPQVPHDLTTQSDYYMPRKIYRKAKRVCCTGNVQIHKITNLSKLSDMCDLSSCETSYYKMLTFLNKHLIFKLLSSYRTNHLKMTVGKLLATLLLLTLKFSFSLLLCSFNLYLNQKRCTSRKLYLISYLKERHTRQIHRMWKWLWSQEPKPALLQTVQLQEHALHIRTEQTLVLQNLSYHHIKMYHKPTFFFF